MSEFEKRLNVTRTEIPGLMVLDLPVHGDARGWFKENWQREKMTALGVPDFRIVQNNISYNAERGVTRGIHAEPWNKFISIARGRVFGAWVDLRPGKTFGRVFTCELDPSRAVYVPRGVGNSFQALEDGTVYTYLVDAHWSSALKKTYSFVNLSDPKLAIDWPIPLSEAVVSFDDLAHPMLCDVLPMAPKRTLVVGCNGQLGRAFRALAGKRGLIDFFDFCDVDTFDIAEESSYAKFDWSMYGTVINCGAYTKVDAAETHEGRVAAWKANAKGPALLAKACAENGLALVHISSDYVFDGQRKIHDEAEPLSPLSVYGQTKAAGDLAVLAACSSSYVIRTSWVIGEGRNFVRTMVALSSRCADQTDDLDYINVVNDQWGRLTFTQDIASAAFWLLGYREGDCEPSLPCKPGIYNVTGTGPIESWAQIACRIFSLANENSEKVVPVSSVEYEGVSERLLAPRPKNSALDLTKIEATGFYAPNWINSLALYMQDL